jgi:stage VI sporulation protein D
MPRVVTSSKSGNFYNYECELNMDFYYEADNRNGLNVKNIKLPFIVKFEGSQGEVEFNITRKQFTIRDENVDLDIEILVKQASVNMKQISIIENVETKNLEEESDYKMFLYFVKAGDTIWNIAKRFRVSMNDIIKLNELENPDRINVGDRLYIMR